MSCHRLVGNDPNGVMQYDGVYHLYYQYSPHNANGGLKYWGHQSSKDLVHFKDHGIVLYKINHMIFMVYIRVLLLRGW